MHRWLLVLLVALLPVRGWVGEAVAAQMLVTHLAQLEGSDKHLMSSAVNEHAVMAGGIQAAPCHLNGHGSSNDAEHHAQATNPPPATQAFVGAPVGSTLAAGEHQLSHDHESCANCVSCQVCAAVALMPPALGTAALPGLDSFSPVAVIAFASAEQARSLKPPIS